ncbi:hypothetical protein GUJ93_ZPchr0004g39490 [Zizania palustris]|uniref:Uncharacterized protein n=1 Tax=Zizania palustris TaxID=103762 RepID=A0A8J5SYJ4_ZIZPA|nr:hypothetical protein GUJ93_ZPchr0004g39490 [Zizania palustris]
MTSKKVSEPWVCEDRRRCYDTTTVSRRKGLEMRCATSLDEDPPKDLKPPSAFWCQTRWMPPIKPFGLYFRGGVTEWSVMIAVPCADHWTIHSLSGDVLS